MYEFDKELSEEVVALMEYFIDEIQSCYKHQYFASIGELSRYMNTISLLIGEMNELSSMVRDLKNQLSDYIGKELKKG